MNVRMKAAFLAVAASMLLWGGGSARGGIVIYGGPMYDSATGTGYKNPLWIGGFGLGVGNGVAVGNAGKYVAGVYLGNHALRWDASGTAVELGNLGTDSTGRADPLAYACNDAGTAVGSAPKCVADIWNGVAVRWDASGTAATELGNLGTCSWRGTSCNAYAVNDAGTAVGYAEKYVADVYMGSSAVRWDASGTAATELGNLGTCSWRETSSCAYAVNNAGTAVGGAEKYVADVYMGSSAVRWDASGTTATELGNLWTDSNGCVDSCAYYITSAGTAVGQAIKYVAGSWMGRRTVRWDGSGTAVELGNLGTDSTGRSDPLAYACNDAGTAVGYAEKYVAGVDVGPRAVRWDASDTTAVELGNQWTDSNNSYNGSFALGINDDGTAVGIAYEHDGVDPRAAVMWRPDGVMIDLNSLIDPTSGWVLTEAWGISKGNWITGIGSFDPDGAGPLPPYDRLFLMQVPEPATLSLLALGGLAVIRRRRK